MNIKKWLLSTVACAVMATMAQADEIKQPYGKLKKQIGIMSNIIESSLMPQSGKKRSAVQVNGIYLKSQGVVFEVNAGRSLDRLFRQHGHDFDFDIDFEGLEGIAAPLLPGYLDSERFGEDIEAVVSRSMQVYEEAMGTMREHSEQNRELKEQQRELAHQIREHAREQRDLEFETRHADKAQVKALKTQLAELKTKTASLKNKKQALAARAEAQEQALKEKRNKNVAQAREMQQHYYAKLEQSIVETLCDYGAGFRQLDKNEQVTFVIDMRQPASAGKLKKIYSFNKKDILSCVKENKTPEQLLKASDAYYF